MSDYPEHDKLKSLSGENNTIASFLEWLQAGGREVCRLHVHSEECERLPGQLGHECGRWEGYYYADPSNGSIETLLAEYFEIDMAKVRDEKEQMYRALVAANEARTA
jgi:hypothetical protein